MMLHKITDSKNLFTHKKSSFFFYKIIPRGIAAAAAAREQKGDNLYIDSIK